MYRKMRQTHHSFYTIYILRILNSQGEYSKDQFLKNLILHRTVRIKKLTRNIRKNILDVFFYVQINGNHIKSSFVPLQWSVVYQMIVIRYLSRMGYPFIHTFIWFLFDKTAKFLAVKMSVYKLASFLFFPCD